jgi:hypothetical protein
MATDPLHHPRQTISIIRRCQQVEVSRHQNIGMQGNLILLCGISQPVQECPVVDRFAKNQLAIDTELNDMVDLLGNNESRKARHGGKPFLSMRRMIALI